MENVHLAGLVNKALPAALLFCVPLFVKSQPKSVAINNPFSIPTVDSIYLPVKSLIWSGDGTRCAIIKSGRDKPTVFLTKIESDNSLGTYSYTCYYYLDKETAFEHRINISQRGVYYASVKAQPGDSWKINIHMDEKDSDRNGYIKYNSDKLPDYAFYILITAALDPRKSATVKTRTVWSSQFICTRNEPEREADKLFTNNYGRLLSDTTQKCRVRLLPLPAYKKTILYAECGR